MQFELLSPNAEKVLEEILANRRENGSCDTHYWEKRFDTPNYSEEVQLRSVFKELEKADMIKCLWGSRGPYEMVVLNNGVSYFDMKKALQKQNRKEKRSSVWRDILITFASAVIGAVAGGAVTYFLFAQFGIGK